MNNPVMASLHVIVSGRVQGVFFRAFVQSHANALNLTGYVRNLQSGSVEVQADGDKFKLEELIIAIYRGPPASRVDKVDISWSDYTGDFSDFNVRF